MKIKKVLVSQPRPTSDKSPYFDIAEKYGVEMVFKPFIKVEGLTVKEFRQSKINLADYTAVVFTARHAVDNFFRLCEESRVKIPDTMRYFCTTESIALYLQKYIVYRKRKISFGLSGKLNDPQLKAAFDKNKKEKFLFPVSNVATDTSALEAIGIDFTPAVMYRTVSTDFSDDAFDYDAMIFFSPAGVDSLKENFPNFNQEESGKYIGAFGTNTQKAVENAGLRLDFAAPVPGVTSMTAALDAFLAKHNEA